MYSSSYYGNDYSSFIETLLIILLIAALIALVFQVLELAGRWKTYDKMGLPGWAALVPVYSSYVFAKGACADRWKATAITVVDALDWGLRIALVALVIVPGMTPLADPYYYSSSSVNALASGMELMSSVINILGIAMFAMTLVVCISLCKAFNKSAGWVVAFVFVAPIAFMFFGFAKDFVYYGPDGRNLHGYGAPMYPGMPPAPYGMPPAGYPQAPGQPFVQPQAYYAPPMQPNIQPPQQQQPVYAGRNGMSQPADQPYDPFWNVEQHK